MAIRPLIFYSNNKRFTINSNGAPCVVHIEDISNLPVLAVSKTNFFSYFFACDVISSASLKQIAFAALCRWRVCHINIYTKKTKKRTASKTSWNVRNDGKNSVNRKNVAFSHSPFFLAAVAASYANYLVGPQTKRNYISCGLYSNKANLCVSQATHAHCYNLCIMTFLAISHSFVVNN